MMTGSTPAPPSGELQRDPPRRERRDLLQRLRSPSFWRHRAVWAVLAATCLVGAAVSANVVAPDRWADLLRLATPLACLALGQTVLVIGRNLDLSVGGVVGLVNVIAAGTLAQHGDPATIVLLCLAVGLAIGLLNGLGVALIGVSPFIMTLGTSFMLTGAALVISGGAPSGQLPQSIRSLSQGSWLGLAPSVWLTGSLFLIVAGVLKFTWVGRKLYARGINPSAARLSGVSLATVDVVSYVFSGFCAAVGGLFLAGAVGQGSLGAGEDLLLNSLAAVVVGGTTFVGGKGGVGGTLGGALLFTVLAAVLTAAGLGAGGLSIASGVVLLAAAALFRRTRTT